MTITNFKNLARNPLRKKALLIAEAGYSAIDIEKIIKEEVKINKGTLNIKEQKIGLNNFRRIYLVGIGKGSALACANLAKILGKRLTKCIALDINKPPLNSKFLILNSEFLVGTHPLPSKQNIKATQKIIKLLKNLKKDDLLIAFICGGGSALLCASEKERKNLILATKFLTQAGANILELNTVRKHLSMVKAGCLAKLVYPATVVSLIVSDVIGNDLSMVASGPTVFDKTTKKDAEKIWQKYQSYEAKSHKIEFLETPKNKKYFKEIRNIFFLSNRESVSAMAKKAKKLGFKPKIYSLAIKGEARRALLPMIKKVKAGEALLAAGETIVKLTNRSIGKGGRNMEAVLGGVISLKTKNLILMAFASDGRDNTEAAGAITDFSTLEKAKKLKLQPQKFLNQNNSFNFFKKTGDLIFSQKKSFNVSDLMLVLSSSKE